MLHRIQPAASVRAPSRALDFAGAWVSYGGVPSHPNASNAPLAASGTGVDFAKVLCHRRVCWLGVKLRRCASGEDKNSEKRGEESRIDHGDADAPAPQQNTFEGRKSG
jgi:hypothetical protein